MVVQMLQEEIHCLEAGADVYLRKPFSPALLLAGMKAVSRRVSIAAWQWLMDVFGETQGNAFPHRLEEPRSRAMQHLLAQ
jgi:DNA-binding response OmpR family regulator